jgi:hypothetical protein
MRRLRCAFFAALFVFLTSSFAHGQSCPVGYVCYDQPTNNRIFQQLSELAAAKDAIAKLLTERGASEVALAQAQKVIEGLNALDAVNGRVVLKHKEMIALQEQVIEMYKKLVTDLEERLNKPRSIWQKIVAVLKRIGDILIGVGIGAAL